MDKADIINEINAGVLTGGRRTKAVDVRKILIDILNYVDDNSDSESNILATSGGGQTGAYQLTKKINRIDLCAVNLDSAKTFSATENKEIYILNLTTKKVNIFPKEGDRFKLFSGALLGINVPITLASRNVLALYCYKGETGVFTQK